jgi:hypothetical protein
MEHIINQNSVLPFQTQKIVYERRTENLMNIFLSGVLIGLLIALYAIEVLRCLSY